MQAWKWRWYRHPCRCAGPAKCLRPGLARTRLPTKRRVRKQKGKRYGHKALRLSGEENKPTSDTLRASLKRIRALLQPHRPRHKSRDETGETVPWPFARIASPPRLRVSYLLTAA